MNDSIKNILNKAVKMFKESGLIDIIKLAREEGVSVQAVDGIENYDAKLEHDSEEKNFSITTNIQHPMSRIRFSVAHELAHYLLHRNDVVKSGKIHRGNSFEYDPQKEREANNFASEILMPQEVLHDLLDEGGVGLNQVVPPKLFNEIADRLQVSKQALAIRLENLGYVVTLTHEA